LSNPNCLPNNNHPGRPNVPSRCKAGNKGTILNETFVCRSRVLSGSY